jgi:electron transport complex protein RnfD
VALLIDDSGLPSKPEPQPKNEPTEEEASQLESWLALHPTTAFSLQSMLLTVPCLILGWYYYGTSAVRLAVVSMLAAIVCSLAMQWLLQLKNLRRRDGKLRMQKTNHSGQSVRGITWRQGFDNGSPLVLGLWMACMLPADIPLRYAIAGCAFAVVCCMVPFGGGRTSPFSPTAVGFAFLTVCTARVFAYEPSVFAKPIHSSSLSQLLQYKQSALQGEQILPVLLGQTVGPMGTGGIIAIAAVLGACFLLKSRRALALSSLGMVLSVAVLSFLFPRVSGNDMTLKLRLMAVGMELCSGMMLFAAVYLLPSATRLPRMWYNKLLYGAMTGAFAILLRHISVYEESVVFAILLANACWPVLANSYERLGGKAFKERIKPKRRPRSGAEEEAVSNA